MKTTLFIFLVNLLCLTVSGQWTQCGNTIAGESSENWHGNSNALSDDAQVLAVGAFRNSDNGSQAGQVRVYEKSDTDWIQIGEDINGDGSNDQLGRSVALSLGGDTLAVGAWDFSGGPGYVRTYVNDNGSWVQLGATIYGENTGDWCGTNVNFSKGGDTLAVGSPGNGNGHVRIFSLVDNDWVQIGDNIVGDNPEDFFGYGVALSQSGNRVVIGGFGNDDNGSNSGHTKVFELIDGDWMQLGNTMEGEAAGDDSGALLHCNSDASIVAIGAWRNDGNGSNSGQARVYQLQGDTWTQLGADLDGESGNDQFGNSIALNNAGNILAVGANLNDGNGGSSGHVQIYKYRLGSWIQIGEDIDGAQSGDENGSSVFLDGTGYYVSMGARYNDDNGTSSGHVRVFTHPDLSTSSTINESACSSYTSPSGEYTWTSSGTYTDIIPNAADCDSVITINLTINNNTGIDVQSACDSFTWFNGMSFTESDSISTETLVNVAGCDSVVTLHLTMTYSTAGTDVQTACDSFDWIDGNTYLTSENAATHTLVNTAGCDSVVTLDLSMGYSNSGTDIQSACDSFLWIDGNTYTADENSSTYTLINSEGCDSVVTLNLTINLVDSAVTQLGPTLTADQAGAMYQWVVCPDMTPIDGATDQSYTATDNGEYAVIVTSNECSDTSTCLLVTTVGMASNHFNKEISVYPNPTTGAFSIDLGSTCASTQVTMTDLRGRFISRSNFNNRRIVDLETDQPPGVYLLKIECGLRQSVLKLIKE